MNQTAPPGTTKMALQEYPRPPWGRRLPAFAIDAFVAAAPLALTGSFILIPLISMMAYVEFPDLFYHDTLFKAAMILFYLSIPWFLFYSLCRDGFRGRSLGKRLCGLIVIRLSDGSPCTMHKSLVRNVLFVLIACFNWVIPLVGILTFLVEPIAVINNPGGRRYGDRWAETQVVETAVIS